MFLDEAVPAARREAELRKADRPAAVLEKMIEILPNVRDFKSAITRVEGAVRIIAEIKRSSPSAGPINTDVSVSDQVSAYCEGGASALSVLTCAFKFNGSIDDLGTAAEAGSLPVLRKDFITTDYQILEARAYQASAILLIAAALKETEADRLMSLARDLGLDVLFEVHNRGEIELALGAGAEIIGINNRNLATLEVDLGTTEELFGHLPNDVVKVSESGIKCRKDVERIESLGVDALLIGGALMGSPDPAQALKELTGGGTSGGEGYVG